MTGHQRGVRSPLQRFGAPLSCVALFLLSPLARAQVSASELTRLQNEAGIAASKGRIGEAFEKFRQVFAATKDPWIACNVGRVSYRLGKMPEAFEYLSICTVLTLDPKTDGARRQRLLSEAKEEIAIVRSRVGLLQVLPDRSGADVFLDGKKVGTSPLERDVVVEPDTAHQVKATLGAESAQEGVTISAGQRRTIYLRLRAPEDASAHADAKRVGPQSPEAAQARTTNAAAASTSGPLTPWAAPSSKGSDAPSGQSNNPPEVWIVVLGFGGFAFGAGLGITNVLDATRKRDEARAQNDSLHQVGGEEPCTARINLSLCKQIDSADSTADVFIGLSVVSFATAATSAAVAIYELSRPRSASPPKGAKAMAVPMPGGGALVVTGSF